MKLRRNQYCPIHRSLSCCGREAVLQKRSFRQMGVQRIEDSHHPRGFRESVPMRRCGSCSTARLLSRTEGAPSATKPSPITTTSCPITSTLAVWEDHGETIIRTIFRPCIGGAIERRGLVGFRPDVLEASKSNLFEELA
jgi:hypothetical protein